MQVSHPWVSSNLPASAPSLAAKGEINLAGDTSLEENLLSINILTG